MTDTQAALNQALSGRYRLERKIGAGGMASVWCAHDLRHDRPVAFKILHPELAATLGPERFQREIKFAARLQHPHILTVYDSGETDGRLWFTMPFVEGESLRNRLTREKQLPVDDALRITRQIADALDYAHQHGIVHRDIKPENILLTGTHALVADFGIARALQTDQQALTQTGLALGTPAYMSPEQASGARELDARTDVYSVGCVLYEMLAGEPPFTGPSAQAVISKRLATPAPSISVVRDGIPAEVERALTRALSRTAVDRFPTAGEFSKAIEVRSGERPATPAFSAPSALIDRRSLVAGSTIVLALLLAAGVFLWRRLPGTAPELHLAPGPKFLAVLPFENLGRPDDEYFADGMTDEVRGKLTSIPALQVIARTSSARYKKTTKTPRQIGQELGVPYLLTGTIRWERDSEGASRVKVSPELIDASTGVAKWQRPFDAVLNDVFQVQADIAGQVARALDIALTAGIEQQLSRRPTANLAAYEAFLRGNQFYMDGAADAVSFRRSTLHYEQAVSLDPTFLLAWAKLSSVYSHLHYGGKPTATDTERAHQAAERALELAPNGPEGRSAMGTYYLYVLGDPVRAHEQYTECRRLAPADAGLLVRDARAELSLGRWDAALGDLEQASRLDPQSLGPVHSLAYTLLRLRRHSQALSAFDRGLALTPGNLAMLEGKAMVFLAQGDLSGARAVLTAAPKEVDHAALAAYVGNAEDLVWLLDDAQQTLLLRLTPGAFDDSRGTWGIVLAQTAALRGDQVQVRRYAEASRAAFAEQLRVIPNDAQVRILLGLALAYLSRSPDAVSEGERALQLQPVEKDAFTGPYIQHQLVRIYILTGQHDKALDFLEPLLKIPYYLTRAWLRIDPNFDPLRNNPRFQRLFAGK